MWLYQLNQKEWSPNRYRLEVRERERWCWTVGKIDGSETPKPGERVVFFYAKTEGEEPGFYGWAIIESWDSENSLLYFTPVSPSDHLKMYPWWDEQAESLANEIRGNFKQKTLWKVPHESSLKLAKGITGWLSS